MENFYIFLDIDGVLNDLDTIKRNYFNGIKDTTHTFNPESVSALNNLFDYLSKKYDVTLVISSVWRINMKETLMHFENNKIDLSNVKKIDKTGYYYDALGKNRRDREIKNYLKEHNEKVNYVAIDDEAKWFRIPEKNKIVTSMFDGNSLNNKKVKEWICKFENREENITL